MCGVLEVIKDTIADESIRRRVAGERGTGEFSLGNSYMPPGSAGAVDDIQKKFERWQQMFRNIGDTNK